MMKLPGTMTAESFLAQHWQTQHLFMPQALPRLRPSISRNELGWLATLEDVESRLVFTDRLGDRVRYNAEMGPFDTDYLAALPKRDWTLLVHDVEKHLPVMRRLFARVPFIPDWRIDDLMVSFAAPGGGVGPHCDNYDVFLCQGIGIRDWHVTCDELPADPAASDDIALTEAFAGEVHEVSEGDVLYLPPVVAHWGTARRACMTYSIGMRAPQLSDLADELPDEEGRTPFYTDPDLAIHESQPGYISREAIERAMRFLRTSDADFENVANSLGRFVTETKDWITPDTLTSEEAQGVLRALRSDSKLSVHGMTRVAYDDLNLYVNGRSRALSDEVAQVAREICTKRRISARALLADGLQDCAKWLLKLGTFEIPEKL